MMKTYSTETSLDHHGSLNFKQYIMHNVTCIIKVL